MISGTFDETMRVGGNKIKIFNLYFERSELISHSDVNECFAFIEKILLDA